VFAAFLISLFSAPLFENDFLRYYWDATQLSQSQSPYLPPQDSPKLAEFELHYEKLDYSSYASIYQASTQILFLLAYKVGLSTRQGFHFALSIVYFLAFCIFLNSLKININQKLCWLLQPLFLRESINCLHFDIIIGIFLALSISTKSVKLKAAFIAIALGFKLGPVLRLLDFNLWRKKIHLQLTLFAAITILPWLVVGHFQDWIKAFIRFGNDWEMNSGLFRWLNSSQELELYLSKISISFINLSLLLALFLFFKKNDLWRKNINHAWYWLFYLFLITSPVVNPWYFLWILPLIISSKVPLHLPTQLSILPLILSYSFYYYKDSDTFTKIWTVEHILMWMALIYGIFDLTKQQRKTFILAPSPRR
jgi:hypothetical protein